MLIERKGVTSTSEEAPHRHCMPICELSLRLCRESDPEKLRELCRKALRECQEHKAANWHMEGRVMRLERDKEILGRLLPAVALLVWPAPFERYLTATKHSMAA